MLVIDEEELRDVSVVCICVVPKDFDVFNSCEKCKFNMLGFYWKQDLLNKMNLDNSETAYYFLPELSYSKKYDVTHLKTSGSDSKFETSEF